MLGTITSWFRSKNITSHSVAVVAIFLATLVTTDQQVRDFLVTISKNHPAIVPDIMLLAGVILKYMHSSSPAGAVAAAQTIEDQPNPPTQSAVDAAKP